MDEFHLNNIAVHPEFIRCKIATKLILHVASCLLEKNIKIILLEVSSHNIAAQKCYESLDFVQVGFRNNYYAIGDSAILYNMDLTNNG